MRTTKLAVGFALICVTIACGASEGAPPGAGAGGGATVASSSSSGGAGPSTSSVGGAGGDSSSVGRSTGGNGGGGASGGAGGSIDAGSGRDAAGSGGSGGPLPGDGGGGKVGDSGSDARDGASTADGGPAGDPALRWLGRVDPTAMGARISWSGTGFVANFNGTAARVRLTTGMTDYFQIVVDGQVSLLTTQSGTYDYDLATGLAQGDHSVTLWRRTEPSGGAVDVGAVAITGKLLAPPPLSDKRIEVVGDSISAGFGVGCKTNGEAFTFATEDNYLTYGAIAARRLGAELFTLAWSGIGMYRDVGGATTAGPPASPQMPVRYLRTIPSDNASTWSFAKYAPRAVVINLGTNDFAQGDPGQPFVAAYLDFAAGVRSRYAGARIYFAVTPMLSGDRRTALKGYLDQVLTARKGAGDANVAIVEFAPVAADAWTCGHPNAATHVIMANVLEQVLKTDLGW